MPEERCYATPREEDSTQGQPLGESVSKSEFYCWDPPFFLQTITKQLILLILHIEHIELRKLDLDERWLAEKSFGKRRSPLVQASRRVKWDKEEEMVGFHHLFIWFLPNLIFYQLRRKMVPLCIEQTDHKLLKASRQYNSRYIFLKIERQF